MTRKRSAADSVVTQDYVKHIYAATEWGGDAVSVTGLAQRMGVAPSTASENVRRLADLGIVQHAPYRGVSLTEAGRTQALTMIRRHRLLETYLHARLGFDWDEVHVEAEALEHAVSDRLIDRIDADLGHPPCDPHGDPIPTAEGEVTHPTYGELVDLPEGAASDVLRISDHDSALLRFFEERNIWPGQWVSVVERRLYADTIVVAVGAEGEAETVELSLSAARAVWVRA